ncbi:putative RNA methyltransferase [Calidifontibacillus oryziterrae]|uniref:putative RNA methyltransferase n=1 Tax=Calidifontibacillus oryziterrae TaxID=1191699 RepID=UPI0002E70FF2|nr:methyltransferase domain-containing protein [Calidifontibacillus oryziterrae]
MTNKEKSAEVIRKFVHAFKCPLCNSSMEVVDLKSLVCSNNHTFDIAKQGYINLMTRSSNSHYDKNLFESRQKIIMESSLYSVVHAKISEIIKEHVDDSIYPIMILDAGCGEGSHLQRIIEECNNIATIGVGLDISKAGILLAAKKYKKSIWLVGDLANSPLEDRSFHVILNILSPSNYKEFKRVLVPKGLIIKVVPRPNYLVELREALFDDNEKKVYQNDETVDLFKKNFYLKDVFNLSYTRKLDHEELENLVKMSPLSWNSEKADIGVFLNRASSEITVDLDILVGSNNN